MGKPTKLKPPKKKTKKQEASDDEVSSEGHDGTVDDRLLVKNGFHILPISLYGTDGIKYLYFRPQKKRSKTSTPRTSGDVDCEEDERTIFVSNLRYDCTREDMIRIFEICGPIEDVKFNSLAVNPLEVAKAQTKSQTTTDQQLGRPAPSQEQYKAAKVHEKQVEDFELRYSFESHGYALVVFESSKSVDYALTQLTKSSCRHLAEEGRAQHGLKLWISQYKSMNDWEPESLQATVDERLRDYDRSKLAEEQMKEELISKPDEEGWVTVVRSGKKRSHDTVGKGATVGVAGLSQAELKRQAEEKLAKKQNLNFYRYQQMQDKQNKLEDLRKKFEDDKRRIARLKDGRKFRPM